MYFLVYRKSVFTFFSILFCIICLYSLMNARIKPDASSDVSTFDWDIAVTKSNIIPIAVIGSGPAGLSAAMYGARAAIKVVVFEGDNPGGLLTKTSYVENWPGNPHILGTAVMEDFRKQASGFGVRFVQDTIASVDFSNWPFALRMASGESVYALSVVIATGAGPRFLNVEGEQEYFGRGVSACARCDAPLCKDLNLIVVGGGDSAIEEALQLAPYAKKITIIHRRDCLRASSHMKSQLRAYNHIEVLYNARIQKIIGDENEVTSVEIVDTQTQEAKMMPIEGLFLAVGHQPNTALLKEYIDTDEQDYIKLETRSQKTNIPGVFAAGDVADSSYRQAGTAAGDGIKAGVDAINFLNEIGFTVQRAQQLAENMFILDNEKPSVQLVESPEEFEKCIQSKDKLAMTFFYAPQEQSSSHMIEILQVAAKENRFPVSFAMVNVTTNSGVASRYHIYKTPCLLAFSDGHLVARYNDGLQSVQELFKRIESLAS